MMSVAYGECRVSFSVMLNVIGLSVFMLNVIILSVVMLSVVAPPLIKRHWSLLLESATCPKKFDKMWPCNKICMKRSSLLLGEYKLNCITL